MTTHQQARRAPLTAPQAFFFACANAGIPPTHRQYRKWCQGRGLARKHQD